MVSIESTPSEGDEDGGQQQKVHDRRGQELAQHLWQQQQDLAQAQNQAQHPRSQEELKQGEQR